MIDTHFKQASDDILNQRMASYKHYTAIVGCNSKRGDLQWYLNRRNRPKVRIFQDVQEVPEQYIIKAIDDLNPIQNPDLLTEEDALWQSREEHNGALQAMSQVMADVVKTLSKNEQRVFQSLRQGKGTTDISKHLKIKQGTVSKVLQRIQAKMKHAHDVQAA